MKTWAGTPWHMIQGFRYHGVNVQVVGPLRETWALPFKGYQLLHSRLSRRRYWRGREPVILRGYARQIRQAVPDATQVIVSPGSIAVSLLDIEHPIVVWTDATVPGCIDYYPELTHMSSRALRNALQMEREAMARARLFIFSSNWAARSAVDDCGLPPERAAVIPFGASLGGRIVPDTVSEDIATRRRRSDVHLAITGVNWTRKGVDIAVDTVGHMRRMGVDAHLDVIGCVPPSGLRLPPYVVLYPFLDKSVARDWDVFLSVMRAAALFIFPTRADCTPIALCEAATFGLPALATRTGGVSSIVDDGTTGILFDQDAQADVYADAACRLLAVDGTYDTVARAARRRYEQVLNWPSATHTVIERIKSFVS